MNIFQEIQTRGHDEDFIPEPARCVTGFFPGSWGKIQCLADRVQAGEDLWHPEDPIERIASIEQQEEALREIKIATAGTRKGKEFAARRAKMNLKSA